MESKLNDVKSYLLALMDQLFLYCGHTSHTTQYTDIHSATLSTITSSRFASLRDEHYIVFDFRAVFSLDSITMPFLMNLYDSKDRKYIHTSS